MLLTPAKKVYADAYCAAPEETIERIRAGFARLGLQITYMPNARKPTRWFSTSLPAPVLGTYSGHAHVKGMPPQFGTNGKGMSHHLSMASAFGELCERYAVGVLHSYYSAYALDRALVDDDVYRYLANVEFLRGYQRANRAEVSDRLILEPILHEGGMTEEEVAELFELPIAQNWVDGFSLTEERPIKVPLTLISAMTGSNGMAAGNSMAEAITHALGEVFERYCTWRIVLDRIDCPTIAHDSIDDPEIQGVLQQFGEAGIDVVIKDFTLGARFPVVGAVFHNRNLESVTGPSARPRRDHFGLTLRAGSAPHRRDALLRCFTEEMQGVLLREYLRRESAVPLWDYWINQMRRRYRPKDDASLVRTGVDRRDFNRHGDISFLEEGTVVAFESLWDWNHTDCCGDVDESLEICRREGVGAVVVDTTHPVIQFPTVMAFVPQFINRSNVFENVRETLKKSIGRKRLGHPADLNQRLPIQYFEFNDDWLYDPAMLDQLIDKIEAYLAAFFPSHQWHAWRRLSPINLCQLLTFLYLERDNYEQAAHAAELWRITGATPGAQRAAAALGKFVRAAMLDPDSATSALRQHLDSIPAEHRYLVTEPRINPFRRVADQEEPLLWIRKWDELLAEEFQRFHDSFRNKQRVQAREHGASHVLGRKQR